MKPEVESETIIGLDLGGTKMLGALINRSGKVLARCLAPTPRGNLAVMEAINALINEVLTAANDMRIHPSAIAIGIPGFVDTKNGVAIDAENLVVKDLPVCQRVTERFQLPSHLYHDVQSAVLGEALYGAGAGHPYFAYLNIGTGVSIGLYLDGRVHHGANNLAGEIGHMCLYPGSVAASQEPKNRLEALASGPALVDQAKEALILQPQSLIHHFAGETLNDLSPLSIQKAAQTGDRLAIELIEKTADLLGSAIGAVHDILDLECVVLGGGVAQMGALLLEPVQEAVARYAIQPVPVLISLLGQDVGVIGVAATYFQEGG